MAKTDASIPQGTRDFGPDVVRKRDFIFDTIENVFELYGFQPLETPAMENLENIDGKIWRRRRQINFTDPEQWTGASWQTGTIK
jgi:histidyl-tRNA synthetase